MASDAKEATRETDHRAAIRNLDARAERVRTFLDAVDLLQGPTKEPDRT